MWLHNLDPVLLHLGPLEIRWYGLVYVLGFFLSAGWLFYARKKGWTGLSKEEIWDLMSYLLLGVLIGSRLFMVFWQPEVYLLKPWNLLYFWQGGMSFHGGLAGIIIAGWLFCQKKKIDFWKLADFLSVPTMFALALGRIANFVNGELVGRVWEGKWCVVFPGYENCRHPSTLYDAGKRFLIFFWLLALTFRREFKPGFIFWNFVFFEGLGRFLVDFYREDALYSGLSLGQWFSLVMVVVAGWVFWKYYIEEWKKLLKQQNSTNP